MSTIEDALRQIGARPTLAVAKKGPRPLSETIKALIGKGARPKYKTGFIAIDDACKGGLPVPRLVIVGGAPGAGKTTLVAQWARRFALEAKAEVYCHCIDEGGEGLAFRLAQQMGCDAGAMESGSDEELKRADALIEETGIIYTDDGLLDEHVALWKPKQGSVMIADSIQTIQTSDGKLAEGPRARIDANVQTIKRLVASHGLLGIATSEISRTFYRSKVDQDDFNPLAAFKESGGIEFAAETALVLRESDEETEPPGGQIVEVAVAKNRRYPKRDWTMVLDRDRATFSEVSVAPRVSPEHRAADREIKRDLDVERAILKALAQQPARSFNEVQRRARIRRGEGQRVWKDLSEGPSPKIVLVDGTWRCA